MVDQGFVEHISSLEPIGRLHYLPYIGVINESAETTQFRVVQDTSCKDKKYTNISVKVQLSAKSLSVEHLTCKVLFYHQHMHI